LDALTPGPQHAVTMDRGERGVRPANPSVSRCREGSAEAGVAVEEIDAGRSGLSRRALIKGAVAVGGVAWTAPVVIESLVSPAGALSPEGNYPCSYITVVYRVGGTVYADKFDSSGGCLGNTTSGTGQNAFTVLCNGVSYTNTISGSGNAIGPVGGPAYPSYGSCSSVLSASGRTITATGGATILFAAAHDGSYSTINKIMTVCPPANPQPNNSIVGPDCNKGG